MSPPPDDAQEGAQETKPIDLPILTLTPLRDANDDKGSTVLSSHVNNDENQAYPLLLLPARVRRRIYLHLNTVPRNEDFNFPYVFNLQGKNEREMVGFHGLLLSCRAVYKEMSTILYSENRFFIRYHENRCLLPLHKLTPSSIARITHLKIVLNNASCHCSAGERHAMGGCDVGLLKYHCWSHSLRANGWSDVKDCTATGKKRVSIDSRLSLAKMILSDWRLAASYLSEHINPNQLELCVVCDVRDKDDLLAGQIVEPLARFPKLKNCHIRLCRKPAPKIQQIAQDAVLQALHIQRRPQPTTSQALAALQSPNVPTASSNAASATASGLTRGLLDLPCELRFQIFEYTDLITPWKMVTWSRDLDRFALKRFDCGYLKRPCSGETNSDRTCQSEVHHGCQFMYCAEAKPGPSNGCFCRRDHSAYSSNCKCWASPKYLFLICHKLRKDSQTVFFSGNRFEIHDFRTSLEIPRGRGVYPYERFAASIFLRDLVPVYALANLRHITLFFPAYIHEDWPREDSTASADWKETIGCVAAKLNHSCLNIRLVMVDGSNYADNSYHRVKIFSRGNLTREQGEAILAGYSLILGPLSQIGRNHNLKFSASLTWPWAWTEETLDKVNNLPPALSRRYLRDRMRYLEEQAENIVMGRQTTALREPPSEES